MLKMMAKGRKGPNKKETTLVILGLSYQNLDRLKKGRPIEVNGESLGLPNFEILIFSGETEESMAHEMQEFIDGSTDVYIDPRLRN